LACERPLISAAVLITFCSDSLFIARNRATSGARDFRRMFERESTIESNSEWGGRGGERYFRIDLVVDRWEALRDGDSTST